MYEDDPQDRVFDVLGEAVFGDHPLGRAGHRPRRRRSRHDAPPACAPSTPAHYAPADVVIAAAGSLDHDAVVELARGDRRAAPPAASAAAAGARAAAAAPALPAQGHRAVPPDARRARRSRATTSGASRCACSTTSSAARRPRGCFRRSASGAGWPTTSTRSSRCTPAPARSASTSARAPTTSRRRCRSSPTSSSGCAEDGVTAEELERSKENVKGRIVLSLESTAARMNRLGSAVLNELPLLTLDEVVERIEAVTLDELDGLPRELLAPERLSAAGDRRRRGRLSRRDRAARARGCVARARAR